MSAPIDKSAALSFATPESLQRLKSTPTDSFEAEARRLQKATKEFEAFFSHAMLKAMRQTVKSVAADAPDKQSGLGKDVFTDLFDMELAKGMSSGKGRSIGEMLFDQMLPTIRARYGIAPEQTPPNGPIPMPSGTEHRQVETRKSMPLQVDRGDAAPFDLRLSQPGTKDPIFDRFRPSIEGAALRHGIDPNLLTAVIRAESSGDPTAVSPKGAKGLMQLIDSTAAAYGVTDSFHPHDNIMGGAAYLSELMERFPNPRHALAAYNAGPTAVRTHGGIPPYPETQAYVERVMADWARLTTKGESDVGR